MRFSRILASTAISTLLVGFGLSGCDDEKHICDRMCDAYFEAEKDWAEEECGGFDESEGEVKDGCTSSCKDEWNGASSDDQDEVEECVNCVLDNIGNSPNYEDILEAIEDECEDECENEEIGEFMDDIASEWYCGIKYDDEACEEAMDYIYDC